ncbi:MAG: aspartate aminotransferase family protein [Rhodocyclaceae bacterium]|jgi:acetylornithine/N-succinyldiaminopimelate aminotransferase|nr:aspartate aminotransferase family protein [Rhodocyclaceae bacterium]MBK6552768.1 aspartate aminotransferase family protein [Rhodocyclaceae bacterium]MBK6676264.1 aspartate aminotransferase family protein [Rhodocyclaceae bacterium]MBK7814956.1 aspartate aminotransferase family protein [Rhodocyclaceae bacterium]MBK9312299.1 aspartate aminotransferase family protein [Rhodocyclaceae bacterium]
MPHLMNTYNRQPVAFTHGDGCHLYDEQGRRYLDALAGIAVNTLGHAHPRLVRAIGEQAGRILHASNVYRVREQEMLSDRLVALADMDEVFFCNSGCEANEAAIKLARMYGHRREIDQPAIIVMEHAFHGRTLATLSATGNRKVQAGFEPLVSGFVRVPFDDLPAIEQVAANNPNVIAVLFEPIQGEGGIHVAHNAYMQGLRRICDEKGWLFMVDEVQCGIGRTGVWFAHQHAGIKPDVMTLAKGLGSGVPIGACLAAGPAAGVFKAGNHGSTFGGNPLACTAALTTIDVIEQDGLLARAVELGNAIRGGLRGELQGVPGVVDIRGDGLMIGVELDRPCGEIVGLGLTDGLLINVTADRVIRLLPALIYTDADARQLVDKLSRLIRKFLGA